MKFILGVHRSPSGHKGCYSGIRSGLASTETRDCGFGPRPGTELAIASCTPALILLNSSCCKAAGRLAKLYVDQGDRVQQGQVIAQMDDRDIQAQLRQQQANLALAEAALAEAVAGSRSEEIAQAENQVKAAQA
ncbi:MAG: biotin/lipoyl-binding protein [Chroococcidiopsidaceae cyanobacterium CP_BM_RX_35]|nr:biotin/lipoyl-binding protein [Chroococcidiopsidaceae cyanobacterium CP_BM_RX_35]